MGYKQLVKNEIGHRYHHFIEQKRKISEPVTAPIIATCWCGEKVEVIS